LLNAGQCFINLYEETRVADMEKACQYLEEGMNLLKKGGSKRYGTWRQSRQAHAKFKVALEACQKK
jgi:hypothetical protein